MSKAAALQEALAFEQTLRRSEARAFADVLDVLAAQPALTSIVKMSLNSPGDHPIMARAKKIVSDIATSGILKPRRVKVLRTPKTRRRRR